MDHENAPMLEVQEKEKEKPTVWQQVYDWLEVVCISAVAVVLIFLFIGGTATVNQTSMTHTLEDGDRLFMSKLFYTPERYDIVVVQKQDGYFKDTLLVKRLIAKGGETITFDFEKWEVYVNGWKLYEPYVRRSGGYMDREDISGYTVTVPEGYYFVMGDNRNGSTDSRSKLVGFVKESEIVGKAVFRFFPLSRIGVLK